MEKNLDVIINSHKYKYLYTINITDPTKTVRIPKGSAILFDANLIHSGTFNKKSDNYRIQMKLTHKNDRKILNYYENYNKIDINNIITTNPLLIAIYKV